MHYHVVIPAAGSGSRMQAGKNKQFIELLGKPLIVHTLEIFEADASCTGITLVVNKAERDLFQKLIQFNHLTKVLNIITGGNDRQESVYNGLNAISDSSVVLIHDGARPFLTQSMVKELVKVTVNKGAAILAVRLKDTIISGSNGTVDKTLDRSSLWAVQTPQAFHHEKILYAHQRAREDMFVGTDDASLVERLGQKVYIVEGDYENIKLTTQEDLLFAEAILKNRQKRGERND